MTNLANSQEQTVISLPADFQALLLTDLKMNLKGWWEQTLILLF